MEITTEVLREFIVRKYSELSAVEHEIRSRDPHDYEGAAEIAGGQRVLDELAHHFGVGDCIQE